MKGDMEDTRTPLYQQHVAAGAKMVPFGGFLMPLEYTGIIREHRAVRQNMGMFDLSHMGEFVVRGPTALEAVDVLVTNEVRNLEVGQARYTPMCHPDGGIVDDLLVYRYPDRVMLVVNAANIDKDFAWVEEHLDAGASVQNISSSVALIAVQGPRSVEFLQSLTDIDVQRVPSYHFTEGAVAGIPGTLSRTGYTGEDGFELYVAADDASDLWRALLSAGEPEGLVPVGLGARDTLRLEAGLALYGNDITDTTSPLEASLAWTVKLENRDFIGRDALVRQKEHGLSRRLAAFQMRDRAIPRPHYPVTADGERVGEVTSGSFSPTCSRGIGFAYLPPGRARPGTPIGVEVRDQIHEAEVVKRPIYKRQGVPA